MQRTAQAISQSTPMPDRHLPEECKMADIHSMNQTALASIQRGKLREGVTHLKNSVALMATHLKTQHVSTSHRVPRLYEQETGITARGYWVARVSDARSSGPAMPVLFDIGRVIDSCSAGGLGLDLDAKMNLAWAIVVYNLATALQIEGITKTSKSTHMDSLSKLFHRAGMFLRNSGISGFESNYQMGGMVSSFSSGSSLVDLLRMSLVCNWAICHQTNAVLERWSLTCLCRLEAAEFPDLADHLRHSFRLFAKSLLPSACLEAHGAAAA